MKQALFLLLLLFTVPIFGQKQYTLSSPDSRLTITVQTAGQLTWSLADGSQRLMAPSEIAMTIDNGEVLGQGVNVQSARQTSADAVIPSPFYRKKEIRDRYNELTLTFKGGYGVIFRCYDDAAAYRFFVKRKGEITVYDETARFDFDKDHKSYVPLFKGKLDNRLSHSYQAQYAYQNISAFDTVYRAFLPVMIEQDNGVKLVITEADVAAYPGMFFTLNEPRTGFEGVFPAYPKSTFCSPTRMQQHIKEFEPFIAKTSADRAFPWRVVAVSRSDRDMAANDIVYRLAAPNKIADISWIRPGKIAWDWWNDWGLTQVDFRAGINTETYKYFIDFAAANSLEYVVLDEGWSPPTKGDVMEVVPQIDLKELTAYARSKNVNLILWVVWNVLDDKMETAFAHYSAMGIKGFKIDFIDRADQPANEFVDRALATAAKYKMVLDLHGIGKPTGQTRTYPNALNFEGVFGLEELKWSNPDMPGYDVTFPFIRQVAGVSDYTQGAMTNANKKDFRSIYNSPMSQGTRAHQVATYLVFDSPLVTLCDSPTAYRKEQQTTDFIKGIPTWFDNTLVLDGKIGEYIITARNKDDVWYVGGLTSWNERDVEVDLSFLPQGTYRVELFCDGINADRDAQDYRIEHKTVSANDRLKIHMAPGGGFALKIYPESSTVR